MVSSLLRVCGRFGMACLLFVLIFIGVSTASAQNLAVTLENRDLPRYHQQYERMEQGDVDVLWVGDSIIHGWEGAGKEVWDEFYKDRHAMNFAIGGDRTGHVLWRIANSPMDKISPKLAIVMIGTNNIGHTKPNSQEMHSTPEETVQGIQLIVDQLKSLYPTTKILLLSVFPRGNQPTDRLRLAVNEINQGLDAIYGDNKVENVQLYDIGELFLTPDGVLSPEIMPDYLHPNAKGYKIWAQAVEPMIADALGDSPVDCQPEPVDVDWWKERFEEKNKELQQGNVDLLMIGDSITHFWDVTPYWENNGFDVWQKYFAPYNPVNLGHGGDQTQHVLWRLDNYDFSKINPRAAVLLIGVNNTVNRDREPKDIALGQRRIVQKLCKLFPDMHVIVLKIFPCNSREDQQQVNDSINELTDYYMRDLPNVEVVDLKQVFLNKDGELTQDVMPDLLHPSQFGYELWGAALYLKLSKCFE
ncbi:MAG: GDSL-type esterase/lipase family protein [Planctomycetia bacterium]|nr:GDSL-type esterase/lipase family protein [Planctomycetia bacterium]